MHNSENDSRNDEEGREWSNAQPNEIILKIAARHYLQTFISLAHDLEKTRVPSLPPFLPNSLEISACY